MTATETMSRVPAFESARITDRSSLVRWALGAVCSRKAFAAPVNIWQLCGRAYFMRPMCKG